ncbi:hypothetical protein BWI17_11350 [Betaproteobacteria bacterium GR16-43]|nr:hypothetical protein BWI17_11350 [Betaproteobacteria bacterium GR16-43]
MPPGFQFMTLDDGTQIDGQGRVAFVSQTRFLEDVCRGDRCFACLASPSGKTFNAEHVLPNWILKRLRMHRLQMSGPHRRHMYGEYRIQCCRQCNEFMGEALERPVSELFKGTLEQFAHFMMSTERWIVFQWLALVFLKVHLKDKDLINRSLEIGDDAAMPGFDWIDLHHAYCVARAFASGATINLDVIGSIYILQLPAGSFEGEFDYADITDAQTLLIRVGSLAIICVLNDACAVISALKIPKVSWSTHADIQLRELCAIVASVNVRVKERPRFSTRFDLTRDEFVMDVQRPGMVELASGDPEVLGSLMHWILAGPLGLERADRRDLKQEILTGRWTSLRGGGDQAGNS